MYVSAYTKKIQICTYMYTHIYKIYSTDTDTDTDTLQMDTETLAFIDTDTSALHTDARMINFGHAFQTHTCTYKYIHT